MMNLIPDEYVVSTGGNFIKLPSDGNAIKVLLAGPCAIGYSYWTNDKKCIRSPQKFTATPDIRVGEDGKADSVKEFMVFPVFLYAEDGTRSDGLLEITQLSIKSDITTIYRDKEFREEDGSFWHAFKISASGKGKQTKYSVNAILVRPTNRPTTEEMLAVQEKYDLNKILYSAPAVADVVEDVTPVGMNGSF
jgi:hypothetical protein